MEKFPFSINFYSPYIHVCIMYYVIRQNQEYSFQKRDVKFEVWRRRFSTNQDPDWERGRMITNSVSSHIWGMRFLPEQKFFGTFLYRHILSLHYYCNNFECSNSKSKWCKSNPKINRKSSSCFLKGCSVNVNMYGIISSAGLNLKNIKDHNL